jgi:hypothetical protein
MKLRDIANDRTIGEMVPTAVGTAAPAPPQQVGSQQKLGQPNQPPQQNNPADQQKQKQLIQTQIQALEAQLRELRKQQATMQ